MKKNRILFESCFVLENFILFPLLYHLETGRFSFPVLVNDKTDLQSNEA